MRWFRMFTTLVKNPEFGFHHLHGFSQPLVTQIVRTPTSLSGFYRLLYADHTDIFTYTCRHK